MYSWKTKWPPPIFENILLTINLLICKLEIYMILVSNTTFLESKNHIMIVSTSIADVSSLEIKNGRHQNYEHLNLYHNKATIAFKDMILTSTTMWYIYTTFYVWFLIFDHSWTISSPVPERNSWEYFVFMKTKWPPPLFENILLTINLLICMLEIYMILVSNTSFLESMNHTWLLILV